MDNLDRWEFIPRGDGEGMVSLVCRDLGMDCPFEMEGTSAGEIMRQFIDHADSAHKMPVLSSDIIFRIQHAMKK
jgi:predicted small metal-binding protein